MQTSLIKTEVENVLVAKCLTGAPCRWHGRPVRVPKPVRLLLENPNVNVIPVCPEMLGGLPCPRPPIKRRRGRAFETCAEKANRKNVTGHDVTEKYIDGANRALAIALENGVQRAVLAWGSPSCSRTGYAGKLFIEHGIKTTFL